MRISMLAILPVVLLASCADESRQAPVSTAFRGSGQGSMEPQPANALPRGAAVETPLTGDVGSISTTRVGPATRGAARLAAPMTSRY